LRCPTLSELPSPPLGKIGWPWTEESLRLPTTISDGRAWPRVSIVTPSYNQGKFIEETVRSVLLQGYPDLEYIVIDGASSDGSVGILRKYENWLAYWVSERDRGQADALRKGFDRGRGELFGWINSDDLLAPCALQVVADAYVGHPLFGLYAGTVENFDDGHFGEDHDHVRQRYISLTNLLAPADMRTRPVWHQPGIFFTSDIYRKSGGINPNYYLCMDYDLLLRMLDSGGRAWYLNETLAYFRNHPLSKTGTSRKDVYFAHWMRETYNIASEYLDRLPEEDRARLRVRFLKDQWYQVRLSLMNAHLRDAEAYLRSAISVGGLDVYRALLQLIVHGMFVRFEHLFRTG